MHNTEKAFVVIGLSARVQNDDPAAIGALWAAFRAGDVRSEVRADAGAAVHCVYHAYEGGFMEPYRMTIGYRVAAGAQAPAGLHRVDVPAQPVVAYRADGPQPETLITQWQSIWQGELNRMYAADYDVYDPQNPELVTVYVGVAEA